MNINDSDALIVVDVQNDLCPGGSAAVEDGDSVARKISDIALKFNTRDARVFASQDWHPVTHSSFVENGGIWPTHCIRGTDGAQFHKDLKLPIGSVIVRKGEDPAKLAYSAFEDTNLEGHLERLSIKKIFVGGLSTEYSVQHTVFDCIHKGYSTVLITDAISAVNANPDDDARAIESMIANGAGTISSKELLD